MAAAHTANLKFETNPTKQKRSKYRETTITTTAFQDSASASASTDGVQNYQQGRRPDTPVPVVVSPDKSWCCSISKPPPPPPSAVTDLKIRHSPSAMESSSNGGDNFPTPFSKFNSALTAGLLNPMSPPLLMDKARSSPTLFEMMASEPDCHPRVADHVQNGVVSAQNYQNSKLSANPSPQDKKALMQQRLMDLLASRSPGNQFNDTITGDVKLTLSSKDGINVSISVHRQILVAHSRFFALKLNEKWVMQQRSAGPYLVEIADCDDIEVYIETLRLMYCKDLRRKLMKEEISRVLGILKVSAAIGFDAGVLSCLEYLEAAPWDKDEEEKVTSLLSELRLEGVGAAEVLKRVSLDATSGPDNGHDHEEILIKLLQVVLEGKDEKARREMKALVTKMLRENPSHDDLRKESLYSACDGCLKSLHSHFLRAAAGEMQDVAQIARQSDNLHWLLDILIDRQIAEEFLKTWASMSELSEAHSKVPAVYRYEVSRVTARLFVGIGKDQLLASKASRCMLLQTWLVPFYNDFGWMRTSKGLDRHLIEEGLSNTILTLPMTLQQDILLAWFDRFLNTGDDCPNIQRGFEVWWRRAFWRRKPELDRSRQMRIMAANVDNS